jgi:hypothetical protein
MCSKFHSLLEDLVPSGAMRTSSGERASFYWSVDWRVDFSRLLLCGGESFADAEKLGKLDVL